MHEHFADIGSYWGDLLSAAECIMALKLEVS